MTAEATKPSGESVEVGFRGIASALDLPPGEPMVVISRRMQPLDAQGRVVEAYAPGTKGEKLSTSLVVIEQKYRVEPCPSCDTEWKLVGTGAYKATRVEGGLGLRGCGGEAPSQGCPEETEPVTARIEFACPDPGLLVTPGIDEAPVPDDN